MNDIKVTVLGSNGWFDTAVANTISLLVSAPDFNIILDAGLGLANLEKFCDQTLPTFLFISHSHLDHLYGIHILTKFNFSAGLTIFGQKGLKNDLAQIFKYPFTVPAENLPYPLKIMELDEITDFPFKFTTANLRHAAPCIGIRLDINGKIISYIADTGLCAGCAELATGSDLLFSECAHPIGQPEIGSWPHLSPENCAKIASENNAKKLVLIHFNPAVYPSIETRKEAEKVAQTIFSNTIAGYDGLEISI